MEREFESAQAEREAFEAWAVNNGLWIGKDRELGCYENAVTQSAFRGYSAALSSPAAAQDVSALARDAERYRWLRYEALNIEGFAPAAVVTDGGIIQQCLDGRDLDEEIDAAISAHKNTTTP